MTRVIIALGVTGLLTIVTVVAVVGVLFTGQPTATQKNASRVTQKEDAQSSQKSPTRGDMTLKAFLLQRPKEPKKIEVEIELSTHYHDSYRDSAPTHYAFSATAVTHNPLGSTTIRVYAPKNSPVGKRLYETLKNGEPRKGIATIHWVNIEGNYDAEPNGHAGAITAFAEY